MSEISDRIADCLVRSGSTFSDEKKSAYRKAIEDETSDNARWLLETILENATMAERNNSPLCDDTGIPHVVLDVGPSKSVSGRLLGEIAEGVREGLKRLPGRPMAVKGEGEERLAQSLGMWDDPSKVEMAPVLIRSIDEDVLRAHVLMLGGGPAIRGRSYRVFHRHNARRVEDQVVEWAIEACAELGCTPVTLAIGIGRSHYEASNLMLQAQVDGSYVAQTDFERRITDAVNESGVGAVGMGGSTTVLGTFVKVGPARASGVRIVCMRPCCCFEPRVASVLL